MVRRLVENQQVGFCQQHIRQCHTFLLTTRELTHRLLQIPDFQLRQYLLGLQDLLRVTLMVEAGIQHALLRIELRRLFQHTHFQVSAEYDTARVIALLTGEHTEQRGLSRAVLGYQSHFLSFGY